MNIVNFVKSTNEIMEANMDIVKGKRMKESMYPKLEVALVAWFKHVQYIFNFFWCWFFYNIWYYEY